MRGVILYLTVALTSVSLASQWGSGTPCPGVNTDNSEYAAGICSNGDLYVIDNALIKLHSYLGSYTWSDVRQDCPGIGHVWSAAINPSATEGYVGVSEFGDEWNIRAINSADGINWELGDALAGWNRYPNIPRSVSCAWSGSGKWLYVVYSDGVVWSAPQPYENPQGITFDFGSDGTIWYADVRFSGDYIVIGYDETGTDIDLYEATGFGSTWGQPIKIDEVNSSADEVYPILGVIGAESENILLWATPPYPYNFDIYYSTGDNVTRLEPTSFGNIKAFFR
ncbi:MAG: hypothetical protein JSW52_07125 [Candidatus Coatesbacteria bacterium]|nr:MAG: hypothetical protein JSW52_07125 [Candidatus Coatesbacteria bacterium]